MTIKPASRRRESREELAGRALKILRALKREYPTAHCELDYRSPYELLVATILSAQCTDVRVNLVTPDFFFATPRRPVWRLRNVRKSKRSFAPPGFSGTRPRV